MMRRKSLKRIGLLLAVLMMVSLLPLGSLSALAEEPAAEISVAGLTLTLPQPGPTGAEEGQPVPAQAGVSSGEGFRLVRANWFLADGSVPARFEAGEAYYAELELEPDADHVFTDDTAVTLDTADVKIREIREDGILYIRTEDVLLSGGEAESLLWVGGVPVGDDNCGDILGDGGKAVFDFETNTLTLDEPALSGLHEDSGAQILAVNMDLTVKGKASLEVKDAVLGISVQNGSLTLDGEFGVKAAACAVHAEKDICFEDGRISAEISAADNSAVRAGGRILVKKADLTALGTACGIRADGVFSLEEGVVKASASGADCSEKIKVFGIQAAETLEIKGGDLTAQGVDAGIFAAKGMLLSGGITLAEGKICGISVGEGTLEIGDGIKRVTADGQGDPGAVSAPAIRLGPALSIVEPEGGKLSDDGRSITEEDGSLARHAVIESNLVTFTVRFETFGGPEVPSQTVAEGQTAQKPADPALEGFRFRGWFEDPSSGPEDPFDFSSPITGDLTLKAYWEGSVQVKVMDDFGSEDTGGLVSLGGDDYRVSFTAGFWREGGPYWVGCKPNPGYRFDHWEDGDGNTLPETGTSFTFSLQDGPKTFVAVFAEEEIVTYLITLDSNGGDPESLTLETTAEGKLDPDEMAMMEDIFFLEGYDLVGWSLVPSGKPLDLENYVFTNDETIYALWAAQYFTVRFESNGGSAIPSQSVAFGETAYEPDDPVKPGGSFDGWYLDQALTRPFDFSTPITEDLVLYAKWEQVVKYTVVSGGGSIYGKTSGEELEIVVKRTPRDGECFDHFTGVKIDGGEIVRGTDYTAQAGSTIITLKPSYLSTLNSGSHIITITFDDGKATTGLTVKAGSAGGGTKRGGRSETPETGDPGAPLLWAGLLVCSAAGLGAVGLGSRKLRRQYRS